MWATASRSRRPLGFRVYLGRSGSPDYGTPVATTPYALGVPGYQADLLGLADGDTYAVAVRAYNASGEESNPITARVRADATGPNSVENFNVQATEYEGD
jgi:hypothetical protein